MERLILITALLAASFAHAASVPEIWEDQLIDGEVEADAPAHEQLRDIQSQRLPWQFRLQPVAWRIVDANGENARSEAGLQMEYSTLTRNWGTLQLEATALRQIDDRLTIDDERYSAAIRLLGTPISENLLGELHLGEIDRYFRDDRQLSVYLRPRRPAVRGGSARVFRRGRFNLQGVVGESYGVSGQELPWFDEKKGDLLAVNGGYQLGAARVYLELWQLEASDDAELSTTAFSTGFHWPRDHQDSSLLAMVDDEGRLAAAAEGEWRHGYRRWTVGAYTFDQDMSWQGSRLPNNTDGGYLRWDDRAGRVDYGAGIDLYQLQNNDNGGRERGISLSGQGSYRLNYRSQIGGSLRWRHTERSGTTERERDDLSLSANVSRQHSEVWSQRLALGTRRQQARSPASETDVETAHEIDWGVSWTPPQSVSAEFSAGYQWIYRTDQDFSGPIANLSINWNALDDLSIGTSVSYGETIGSLSSGGDYQNRNTAWQANVNWQINDNWSFTASGGRQLSDTESRSFNPALNIEEERRFERGSTEWLVRLTWRDSGGARIPALGFQGKEGTGRIVGLLFADKNGDGIRQANEQALPSIDMVLDSYYPLRTDLQGRFEIGNVATGTHQIIVDESRLPLPWELGDNARVEFDVKLRETTVIEIAAREIAF